MNGNAFNELFEILDYTINMHKNASAEWQKIQSDRELFNLKRKYICDIKDDESLMKYILEYRDFCVEFAILFNENAPKSISRTRVKEIHSLQQKIDHYCNRDDKKYPIIKSLNDLFGIRYIYDGILEYNDINEIINIKYKNLKCIDSSKGDYTATHVYFKIDNSVFPWELQIWNRKDEQNNMKSHSKYKQGYTDWEKNQKGEFIWQ